MASSRKSVSPCPVCHRTERVRTMQTAYEAGELPLAPPPMPVSHVFLVRYLIVGMALVGGAVFLSFVILATGSFSWLQMMLSLVCIVIALLGIVNLAIIDELITINLRQKWGVSPK